jgi:glycosyltransferase involved in cell wall biosynthesis
MNKNLNKHIKKINLKISIITICLNNEKTIKNTLDSVKNQKFENIEHIVIDGRSKDKTLSIVKQYPNISKVISESDKGIYDALNKGIKISSGDIIGILHADDIFYDNHVVDQISKIFKKNSRVEILSGNVVFFNQKKSNINDRIIRSDRFKPWMLRFGFMPAHTATFFKKSIFKNFGVYDTSFKSAGDYDFFLRLILVNKVKLFFINKILVRMRTKGTSTSGIQSYLRTSIEILNSLKKNGFYSNFLFVILRLPFKLIDNWIFKFKNINK